MQEQEDPSNLSTVDLIAALQAELRASPSLTREVLDSSLFSKELQRRGSRVCPLIEKVRDAVILNNGVDVSVRERLTNLIGLINPKPVHRELSVDIPSVTQQSGLSR